MKPEYLENIKDCPLFKGFTKEELLTNINSTHYNITSFHKHDLIALAGEDVIYIRIVLSGKIKTELVNTNGKVLRLEEFRCSRLLAPAFIFGAVNKYPVNVIAVTDCEIINISKADFLQMLTNNPTMLNNFLRILSDKTQFLVTKIKNNLFLSLEGKIANYILTKANIQKSDVIILKESQQWLAERFGVARPSLTRVISTLKRNGVINILDNQVEIIDKKRLIELSNN